jgi:hypothetical protein
MIYERTKGEPYNGRNVYNCSVRDVDNSGQWWESKWFELEGVHCQMKFHARANEQVRKMIAKRNAELTNA